MRWIGEHARRCSVALVVLAAAVLFVADLGWASLAIVVVLVAAGWFTLTYLRDQVAGTTDELPHGAARPLGASES